MPASLAHRAAARDRALLERLMLGPDASAVKKAAWSILTRSGGASVTLCASLAPMWFENSLREGARRATMLLVVSHLLVQVLKRIVSRPRPASRADQRTHVPDRFSFPSGHAAAALSVALGYASAHPTLAIPLLALAGVVGASRVVLGVHFPADVLAGQVIALTTAAALSPVL